MKKYITKFMSLAIALPVITLVASAVVGLAVTPAFAIDAECDASDIGSTGLVGSAECAGGSGQAESLTGESGVFKTVTNILLFIIGAVSVIMLVIGGIRYTISGGDSTQITAAKNTILYAIIGIVVAIIAYAAVNFVIGSFGANETA